MNAERSIVLGPAFARNLKRLRMKLRLTLEQLAARVKLSPQYLSLLERGRRDPTLLTIEILAAALGRKPQTMLTEELAK